MDFLAKIFKFFPCIFFCINLFLIDIIIINIYRLHCDVLIHKYIVEEEIMSIHILTNSTIYIFYSENVKQLFFSVILRHMIHINYGHLAVQ